MGRFPREDDLGIGSREKVWHYPEEQYLALEGYWVGWIGTGSALQCVDGGERKAERWIHSEELAWLYPLLPWRGFLSHLFDNRGMVSFCSILACSLLFNFSLLALWITYALLPLIDWSTAYLGIRKCEVEQGRSFHAARLFLRLIMRVQCGQ